ncbi:peptide/nickel transport system substrate-binding protein [Paenibacillus castaneae]|uniref:peptide-binding protein n=1 Tax=Paenibacillus castaneae TaxID=474957 RepID=UPI000C9AE3CA|nr:peptide-binding protein [Paenibacillus castaneae]NIK76884.1 peptide/nickel transport system substrate-binding protein [Paenibacillus castaneae]
MKNKQFILILALTLIVVLTACTNNNSKTTPTTSPKESNVVESTPGDDKKPNADGPQKGGEITAAMFSPPDNQFNPIFYDSAYDANILDLVFEGLVEQNDKLEFIPLLAKEWKFNDDFTELTYILNQGVKWQDGETLTADDVVFTYKSIADPDYTAAGGVRVEYVDKLVGYDDYVGGKSTEFPGVVKVDDYTVTFKFSEPNVTAISNTAFPIIPKHIFKDVAVKDMPTYSASFKAGEVIGTGPFKLTKYQEGEQYILERFDDYWQGAPYLDRIVYRVLDQAIMSGMLQNNELDLVTRPEGIPASDADDIAALPNVKVLEQQALAYQYLGFKLHTSTDESKWNDPSTWKVNEKVADKRVRQAIAYAINRQGFVDGLLFGKGTVIDAPFPEASWAFDAKATIHYDFNADKAKALLDEAGYKDTNGDGFREDPNGKEWILNLDYPTGNKVREKTAPIIVENLKDVGIKVNLRNPRDASSHFAIIEKNNTDLDMYLAGWSLDSGDPDPAGISLSTAPYNYIRWMNKDSDDLIKKAMKAPEAFDIAYRKQIYSDWAKLYSEEQPAIILYSGNDIHAWNSRLQGISVKPHTIVSSAHLWWVKQ